MFYFETMMERAARRGDRARVAAVIADTWTPGRTFATAKLTVRARACRPCGAAGTAVMRPRRSELSPQPGADRPVRRRRQVPQRQSQQLGARIACQRGGRVIRIHIARSIVGDQDRDREIPPDAPAASRRAPAPRSPAARASSAPAARAAADESSRLAMDEACAAHAIIPPGSSGGAGVELDSTGSQRMTRGRAVFVITAGAAV